MPGKTSLYPSEKNQDNQPFPGGEDIIKPDLVDVIPNHPYSILNDDDMTELTASMKAGGQHNSIIVRSITDGRHESMPSSMSEIALR